MDFGSLVGFIFFGAIALSVVIVIVVGVLVAIKKKAAQKLSVVDGVEISPPRRNPGNMTDEKVIEAYRKVPVQVRSFSFIMIGLGLFLLFSWFSMTMNPEDYPGAVFTLPAGLLFLAAGALAIWIREPASMGFLYLVFIFDGARQLVLYRQNFNMWQMFSAVICFVFFVFFVAQRNIYRAYSSLPEEKKTIPVTDRADRVFPIASIVLGGASVFISVAAVVLMVLLGSTLLVSAAWFGLFTNLGVILGILAAALGVTGLYYGFKQRWLLIIGTLIGAGSVFFLYC